MKILCKIQSFDGQKIIYVFSQHPQKVFEAFYMSTLQVSFVLLGWKFNLKQILCKCFQGSSFAYRIHLYNFIVHSWTKLERKHSALLMRISLHSFTKAAQFRMRRMRIWAYFGAMFWFEWVMIISKLDPIWHTISGLLVHLHWTFVWNGSRWKETKQDEGKNIQTYRGDRTNDHICLHSGMCITVHITFHSCTIKVAKVNLK